MIGNAGIDVYASAIAYADHVIVHVVWLRISRTLRIDNSFPRFRLIDPPENNENFLADRGIYIANFIEKKERLASLS